MHAARGIGATFQYTIEDIAVAVHPQSRCGQPQRLQGTAVGANQHIALKRQQAFAWCAQAGMVVVQPQHGMVLIGLFKQAVFDQIDRGAHQRQDVGTDVARLAG
ncbi:hypothetical protein G6F35_010002 [Rhizopus arrhizus]|nr:hypothetical protein G6F35_010002 [Rhizopus arrhizus]KAG1243177.1 hypothetical protein G6F65_022577 [Rhizopus arrhizus]